MSVPQPHSQPVVYIVDDDSAVRDSLDILLRLHGYATVSLRIRRGVSCVAR